MFDYMTKIRLRSYNARKVVTSSKLEESLTAAKVIATNAITSDPYASYGTEVPRVIPGSKQYWKSFSYDLVAMTEQLGIPDFFLPCPLMITGLKYNQLLRKDGVLVQILRSFKI